MTNTGLRNLQQSDAFVAGLVQGGLRHACICPGSRSTPLALAFARNPQIQHWVLIDERSCAFFAHGIARQLGEPVAILCSSGTAAANFLPAVVESYHDRVPLLVLTADRPPELRQFGAAQTIDQINLYGSHVKWFVDMPVPDELSSLQAHAATVAARAISSAMQTPQGPVHINFPFREPLLPAADELEPSIAATQPVQTTVRAGSRSRLPGTEHLDELAATLSGVDRGAIICGPQRDPAFASVVVCLAQQLGWPVLADPLSQVRSGEHDLSQVIDSYDIFLRDQPTGELLAPDLVLRFGAMPTSKPLMLYLQQLEETRVVLVEEGDIWRDQSFSIAEVVQADPTGLCEALCDRTGASSPNLASRTWLQRWQSVQSTTRTQVQQIVSQGVDITESGVFAELADLVTPGSTVYAGNSMPVRDLDAFFPALPIPLTFQSNRGANGIDGVVSSALGAAAVANDPVILVIGDLSFYHDMNGLFAAKKYEIDATVILVNNDGGGIFHFLPQNTALDVQTFEDLFGTPSGLDFSQLQQLYGIDVVRPSSWSAFRDEVQASVGSRGVKVIEVVTDRTVNLQHHRDLVRSVLDSLKTPSPVAAG